SSRSCAASQSSCSCMENSRAGGPWKCMPVTGDGQGAEAASVHVLAKLIEKLVEIVGNDKLALEPPCFGSACIGCSRARTKRGEAIDPAILLNLDNLAIPGGAQQFGK